MIARHWRGWVRLENVEAYEKLLKSKVLPGLKNIEGVPRRLRFPQG